MSFELVKEHLVQVPSLAQQLNSSTLPQSEIRIIEYSKVRKFERPGNATKKEKGKENFFFLKGTHRTPSRKQIYLIHSIACSPNAKLTLFTFETSKVE